MSDWSDLYAGDVEVITEAFVEARRAEGPRILAHVALPGVVPDTSGASPNTPELLTELAASTASVDGLNFAGSISGRIIRVADPEEAAEGAFLMSADWVSLFAGLTDPQVQIVAQRWARERDPGVASDAPRVTALVQSVREVCRVAKERRMPVVYTWTT
jgi:hypothetical protein